MAIVLNSKTFQSEVLEAKGVVLVDFYADWCAPCKMLGPIVEEVGREYEGRAKICKINIDQAQDIAVEYQVMSIPTLMVFKDGKKQEVSIGFIDKGEVAQLLDRSL